MELLKQLNDNWDDCVYQGRNEIIFTDRNKLYGAFDIRRTYNRTVIWAFFGSLFFLGSLFLVPTMIINFINGNFVQRKLPLDDPNVFDPNEIFRYNEVVLPKEMPAQSTVSSGSHKNISDKLENSKVENNLKKEEAKNEISHDQGNIDKGKDSDNLKDLGDNGKDEFGGNSTKGDNFEISIKEEEPMRIVQKMPSFVGGEEAFLSYIKRNIHYPFFEKENGIMGIVYISFVINKEGKVENVEITRGVKGGKGLEIEAKRVIENMPDWKPGLNNNKPVKVLFTFPINFKLGES